MNNLKRSKTTLFSAALIWIDVMGVPHVGKFLELENWNSGSPLDKADASWQGSPACNAQERSIEKGWLLGSVESENQTEAEVSFEDFYSLVHSLPTPTAQGGGARINSCIEILCPWQLSQVFFPKVSLQKIVLTFQRFQFNICSCQVYFIWPGRNNITVPSVLLCLKKWDIKHRGVAKRETY